MKKELPRWVIESGNTPKDYEYLPDGTFVWKDGDWNPNNDKVIWKYGIWLRGDWNGGVWKDGIWDYGYFNRGTWENGIWRDGKFLGDLWQDGYWHWGEFKGGVWEYGIWYGGYWDAGDWLGGEWGGGWINDYHKVWNHQEDWPWRDDYVLSLFNPKDYFSK